MTLRNEPVYDRSTLEWLLKFKEVELSGDQKRVLAYAHAHGDRFTSRDCQNLLSTDIYGASTAIKDMIRKGVARSPEKRSRIYLVQEPFAAHADMPAGFVNLLPVLQRNGGLRNEDVRKILALNRIAATRYLGDLTTAGWLIKPDKRGLGALYAPGPHLLHQSQTSANSSETDAIGAETDAMKP